MGKRKLWKQWMTGIALTAAVFSFGACQKAEEGSKEITPSEAAAVSGQGQEEENLTQITEPVPEPTADITPTPTMLPEPEPEETEPTIGEPEPVIDDTEAAQQLFATVSPVPETMVKDIAGTMTKEDFPVIDGSTATIPLSQKVYQIATGEGKEEAEKAITHTKTTNSYYRLYAGEADLLIVYEPSQAIIEKMQTEELLIKPIGLDALVFMENAANPVGSLTKEQLVDIYSGKIKNWSEVGGEDQALLAFQRPAGSGSQTLMQKLVMGDTAMEEGDNIIRYSTMADILEGMLSYTGDDNTLGYSVFYYANYMYSLPELKFLGIDGVVPSARTIYDGSYPFVNSFYAVIRPDEPEDSNARRIFDWLTGDGGQQAVLELGYVPVRMPEGAELSEAAPELENDIQLTPSENLKEGEHFIFSQYQSTWTEQYEYDYGTVTIYDNNWNKCAAFYNAWVSSRGLCDDRYILIEQNRVSQDKVRDTLTRVYDLEENEFLTAPELKYVVSILDGKKGYFLCRDESPEEQYYYKVVDLSGNILINAIPIGDYVSLYRRGDFYYVGDQDWSDGWNAHVYDLDFRLKGEIYKTKADMPAQEDRLPGIEYICSADCVLDREGHVLINRELFLEKFGLPAEENMIGDEYITMHEDDACLYRIEYGETAYYVDKTLNFYVKEGNTAGRRKDETASSDAFYYYAYMDDQCRYFAPDGELLRMTDGEIPDWAMSLENQSYILVRKQKDSVTIEEYVPGQNYFERYDYPIVMDRYDSVEYCGLHCFALEGHDRNAGGAGEESGMYVYYGNELLGSLEARYFSVWQNYDEKVENSWLIIMGTGERLIIGDAADPYDENTSIYLERYGLLTDGKLLVIDEPGYLQECLHGFMQITHGNYTYVYDYDGNVIIKAFNRKLIED